MWAKVRRQQGFANQSFGNVNISQEAMNWLATTCINNGDQLQEYLNKFKLNVIWAKYDETKDAATLISYFSTGIC